MNERKDNEHDQQQERHQIQPRTQSKGGVGGQGVASEEHGGGVVNSESRDHAPGNLSSLVASLPVELQLKLMDQLNVSALSLDRQSTSDQLELAKLPVADGAELTFWTEAELRQLDVDQGGPGFIVRDNFLSAALASSSEVPGRGEPTMSSAAAAIRRELVSLRGRDNTFRPAKMIPSTQSDSFRNNVLRGDEIMWLGDKSDRAARLQGCPALRGLLDRLDALRDELDRVCQFGSQRSTTQLACYPGGGSRYVRHLDAVAGGAGAGRRLTFLYYANPDWRPGDGGCLRLYLRSDRPTDDGADVTSPAWVDLEPLGNRLLVFQSRLLEHEVLPSQTMRFSVTSWLY